MLIERSLRDFLGAVQDRTPTPGGGSVAALSGALGASLFAMVLRFSIGKKTADQQRARFTAALELTNRLANELLELVDKDAAAYEAAVAAARAAREANDRQDLKQHAEAANENAARVPLGTASQSLRVLRELDQLAAQLNQNLSSDTLVAAHCLLTAVRGAVLNVNVNLPSVSESARAELAAAAGAALKEAEAIVTRIVPS